MTDQHPTGATLHLGGDAWAMPSLAPLLVPIDTLTLYPGNPRRGDQHAITNSIRDHGLYAGVVTQTTITHTLVGNHRLRALLDLGATHCPSTPADVDDTRAAQIVARDNLTSDRGGYDDTDQLALLEALAAQDELPGSGYSPDDLAALRALAEPPAPPEVHGDPDVIPEAPAGPPVTQPGDVWQLGPHRILCGDSRDPEHVALLMKGARVNIAFTSPPYASQRTYDESSGFKPIRPDEYAAWFDAVQANVAHHLAADGSWFINIKAHTDDGQRHLYVHDLTTAHVREWGWRFVDELCWVDARNGFPGRFPNRFKNAWEPVLHFSRAKHITFHPERNAVASAHAFTYDPASVITMGGDGYTAKAPRNEVDGLALPSNVVSIGTGGDGSHTAAFPVALPTWFIRAYTDPADAVLDPFMGSGTTLIAAHNEHRVAYGTELSPTYVDTICRRFQRHTGITPTRDSEGHDFT